MCRVCVCVGCVRVGCGCMCVVMCVCITCQNWHILKTISTNLTLKPKLAETALVPFLLKMKQRTEIGKNRTPGEQQHTKDTQ